jgi:hypothetical protein
MTFLFVDTNVLLHYRRLEEIDWLTLSKSSEVVIVLCPVVIRELDNHKVSHPQKKFRKRAQEVITSLNSRLNGAESDMIRDGVRLEFLAEEPDLDFGIHKLRTELPDDWLIASALGWRQKHPSDETKLVSADLGVFIKAKAKQIPALTPLEADKIADELDADEKRIKKLQDELSEIKKALPDLTLCFADGQNVAHVKILSPKAYDTDSIAVEMERIRAKYPLHTLVEDPKHPTKGVSFMQTISRSSLWPREDILKYNSSLESFYGEYEKYLQAVHEHQNVERRMIHLEVFLKNVGGSPAEDVDIHFHFPDGFQLLDAKADEIPKPPEQPDPPHKLGTFGFDKKTADAMSKIGSYALPRANLFGPPPNVSSPSIQRTNSYDVQSHVNSAKHGYQMNIANFLAVFDSYASASSFQIEYEILAGNIPKRTTGRLSVVVEKQSLTT